MCVVSTITDNDPHFRDEVMVNLSPLAEPVEKPLVPSRPGSKWATGNRMSQKGFSKPQGFARGARVK